MAKAKRPKLRAIGVTVLAPPGVKIWQVTGLDADGVGHVLQIVDAGPLELADAVRVSNRRKRNATT